MRKTRAAQHHPTVLAVGFSALIATGGLIIPLVAQAQQATGAEQATRAEAQTFDIPAGPLSQVLSRFAGAAGVALSFDAAEFNNIQSPGLQGRYTVDQGFATLLNGTGTIAMRQGSGGYVLERSEPFTLAPITVEGRRTSGTGPIEGFRAERSSSATNVDAPLIETPATVNVLTRDFLDTLQPRQIEDGP